MEFEPLSTTEGKGLLLAARCPEDPGPLRSREDDLDLAAATEEAGLLHSRQSDSIFIHLLSSHEGGQPGA